jgi:hypothetical protein
MTPLWGQVIRELRELADRLDRDDPVEVTEVRRVKTPDGPMHLQTKKIWNSKEKHDDDAT